MRHAMGRIEALPRARAWGRPQRRPRPAAGPGTGVGARAAGLPSVWAHGPPCRRSRRDAPDTLAPWRPTPWRVRCARRHGAVVLTRYARTRRPLHALPRHPEGAAPRARAVRRGAAPPRDARPGPSNRVRLTRVPFGDRASREPGREGDAREWLTVRRDRVPCPVAARAVWSTIGAPTPWTGWRFCRTGHTAPRRGLIVPGTRRPGSGDTRRSCEAA